MYNQRKIWPQERVEVTFDAFEYTPKIAWVAMRSPSSWGVRIDTRGVAGSAAR